jgi:hypothetical protein
LASHRIYDHLIPQLSKFNRGIEDSLTRRELIEVFYGIFKKDEVLKARLKQKIKTGEVHEFISELIFQDPLILVIIDEETEDLKEALRSLRVDVKVVEFKTFRREGVSEDVNAFVFEPLSTKPIIPLKPGDGTEPRSGPEPEFSKLKGLEVNGKTRSVTMDDRTFELVRDNPHRFSEEEIYQIICEEWPGKVRETVRNTTHRRLTGHLNRTKGVRIEKDASGKYFVVE